MNRYGKYAGVVAISLLFAVFIMQVAGCSFEIGATTASLNEVTMCRSVDADGRPLEKADTFSIDAPEIFCSARLSNAPSKTQVKAVWVYIQGENKDLNNYEIIDYTMEAEGTRYIHFSITRPENSWPRGEYRVKLFIDNNERTSASFTVQ